MSGSDVAAHSMSSEMDMDDAVPGPDFSDNPVCSGDGKMCGECGKIFSHPFYFSTHISIHASEKNFAVVGQCALCGLTFADAAIFSQHLNSSQNRMAVQVPEEEEDSRDQSNYSNQYDTSQNLEDYNQNGVGMSNESMARTSGENKNNVSSESLHRDHQGGSDFEPKAKRRRKMPERYDPDAISEPPRLHPDEDPAVEAYLMSLTEMGLTVDPAAFASHGKGRSRKSFGPSKGKWKGKRFPSHDPLSGDFFPPRKPSPKYEYVDYDVLLEDDMEILPKSGKQTRGLRLQQRHERLSGEPGGAGQNDMQVKTEEPSAESSSSVRTSTASSSSHPDPVPSTSAGDKMPSRGFALDKLSVKTELIDKDYNPRGGTHTKPKPKAPPQPPKQVPNSQPSPSAEPPPAPRPGLTGYARANPAFRPANSVNPALHANIKRPGTLANPQRMRNPASLASPSRPSPKAAKSKGIERFKQESREYVEIMLQSLTSELIPTKMGKNPVATKTIYGRPADGYAANFPGYQPRFPGSRGSASGPRHNTGRGRADTLFFKGGQLRYQPRPGLMNPPFNEVQGLWSGSSNGTTLHGQSSRWNSNPPVSQRGAAANTSQRGRGGNAMQVGRGGVAMNARGGGAQRKIVPVGGPVTHVSLAGQPRPNPNPGAVFPVQMSRGGSVVGRGAAQVKAATPAVPKTPQPFLNTNEVIVVDDDDEDVNKVSKKSVEVPPESSEKSVKKSAMIVDIDKAENPVADIAVIRDKNKDLEIVSDAEMSKDKKLSLTPAVCLTRIDEVKGEAAQVSPGKEKPKTQGENNAGGQDPLLEVEDIEGWKVCLAENSESEASEGENSESHCNQPSPSQVDENKSSNNADEEKVSDLKDEDAGKNLDKVNVDGQREDTSDGDSIAVATAPSVPLTFPNFIGDTDNLLDIFSEIEKTCKEIEENSGNEREDSGTESDAKDMKPTPEYEKPVADPQGEDSWTEPEGEEEEEGNQEELGHKISDILKSLEGGEAKEGDEKSTEQERPVKESVEGVEGENMFRDEIQNILKSIGETGDGDGGTGNEVKNSTIKDNNEKVDDEKKENNQDSDIIDAKSPCHKKSTTEENGNESAGYENGGDTTMETDEDESEKPSDSKQQTTVKPVEVSHEETVKDELSGSAGQELSESYEAGEPGSDPPHQDSQDVRERGSEAMDVDEPNTESKHDEEPDAGEEEKDEHTAEEEKNEQGQSVCQDEEVTDAEVPVEVEKADIQENMEANNVQDTGEDLHTESNGEVAPAEEIEEAEKKKSPSRSSCKDSEDLPGDPRDDGGDEDDKQWRQRTEPSPPSAASHSFSFTALTSTSTDGTSTSGNSQPSDGAADVIAGSRSLTATINLDTLLSDLQSTLNPSLFGKASHCDVDHSWTNHNINFQASTLSQHTDCKQIPEHVPSSFSPARISCVPCHCLRQESCNNFASPCRKLQWSKSCCTECSMPLFKYASMYKKKRFSTKPLGCRSLTKVLSGKFSRPIVSKVKAEKKFKMCLDQFASERWELKHMSHKLNSQLNVLPARIVHALHNKKLFAKVLQEKLEDFKGKKETHSTFLHRNTVLKKQKNINDSRKECVGNFKVHSPKLTWENLTTFAVYPLTTSQPHSPRALKATQGFSGKPWSVFPGTGAPDKLKSCDGWKVMTCGTQEKSSGTTYQSGISGREVNRSEGRHSSNKSYSLNSGSNRGDGDGGEDEDNPGNDNTSCKTKFYGKCPLCGLKLKSIKIAKRHLATHVSKPINTDAHSSSSKKHEQTLSTEAKQNIPPDLVLSSMKSTHTNTNLYESVKIPTGCGITEIIAVKPTMPVVRKHVVRPSKYYKSPVDTPQDLKIKRKYKSRNVEKGKNSVINKPLCLISEVRSLQQEIPETSCKDGSKKLSSHHEEVTRENVKNIQRTRGQAGAKKKDLHHQGVGSCSTDVLPRQDIEYSTHSLLDNPTYSSFILATAVKSEPLDFTSAPETNVTSHDGDLQGKCTVDQQSKNLTSPALFPAVKTEPVELSEVSWSCASGLNKHSAEENTNILANQVRGLRTNVSLYEFDEKPIDIEVKAEPLTESDEEEDLLTVTFDDNCLPLRQLDELGSHPSLENPLGEKSCKNFPYTVSSMTHVHNDSQNSSYTVPGFSRKGLRTRSVSKLAKDKRKDTSGSSELASVQPTKLYKVDDLSDDDLIRLGIPLVYVHPTKPVVNLGFPRATRSTRICATEEANLLQQVTSAVRSRSEDSTADELSSVTKSAASAGSPDVKSEAQAALVENKGNQVDCVDNIQPSYTASLVGESSYVENTTIKSGRTDKFDKKLRRADKSAKKSSRADSVNVSDIIKPSCNAPSSTESDCTQIDKNLAILPEHCSTESDCTQIDKNLDTLPEHCSTESNCTQIDKNLTRVPAYQRKRNPSQRKTNPSQRKTNPSIVYVHPKKPVINYQGRVQRNDKLDPQVQKRSKHYKKIRVGKVTYQML
ncbi:uncharacterized protein LOC131949121 [Physella acuta]|uniref:uncharacterized protein LOC131949121 n=1 Tax=Physella acuta TaxID=109671 RepID=UPI0027DCB41F|nr:uncharacterized protein LOC131949121 [Physella acuta]